MVSLEFHDPSGAIEVKQWEHSKIPAGQLRRAGCPAWIEIDASKVVRESLTPDPSYWLQGYSPGVVGRPIELPPSFESLLADAERDLGPR